MPSQGPAGAGCASKFTQRCLAGSGGPVPCRLVDEATPLPAGLLHRSKFTSRQRTSMADGSLWSSNHRSETLHACRILFMRSPPGPAHTHGEMTRGRDHQEARIMEQLPTAHLRRADGLRGLLLECAESTCHTGGQEIAPHSRCFPRPSFAARAVFSHRWGTRPPIAISEGGALLLFPEAFSPLHSYISSTYSASLWVKLDVPRREFSLPAGTLSSLASVQEAPAPPAWA